ncbi:alpha/beta-hydrolase [Stereum hirsutum FP-91666 SS1]|uniref:alpha/beta-hydrolase n=1 Tax=Stereum hirsutum (strain FP-91666) TaxID=721885 RepID=UPI000440FB44|nr:alpha/beta-hydrolase [Stereum hirsutum FP-91666 SS1]EIM89069.1 alpha/beta-hydrolase [Stereum hirsutum FP-91666 SS1]
MSGVKGKRLYKALTSLPSYSSAEFVGDGVISVTSSFQDHIRNTRRSFLKTIFFATEWETGDLKVTRSLPQDVSSDIQATLYSPSRTFNAILRETSTDGIKKRFVEIWYTQESRLEAELEVTSLHGSFYSSSDFKSLSFSPSENALVYSAEANEIATEDADPYARFRYIPDGGESMTGLRRPTLFVAVWKQTEDEAMSEMTVQSLELPKDKLASPCVIFGQAVFAQDDTIIATGYQYTEDGRRLGTIWCANRPCAVWELRFDITKVEDKKTAGEDKKLASCTIISPTIISNSTLSSRFPRVYKDPTSGHSTALWLSHATGGAHFSCFSLHSFDLQARKSTELIPVVSKPDTSFMAGFSGLIPGIPKQPFLVFNGKTYMIAQSGSGTKQEILLIDTTEPCHVVFLTRRSAVAGEVYFDHWCWNVIATDGGHNVLLWRSSSIRPPQLLLGTLTGSSTSPSLRLQVIDEVHLPLKLQTAISSLKLSVVRIPDRSPFEMILIEHSLPLDSTTSRSARPLVTWIHGGPHGSYLTSFYPVVIALALQGYTISMPNYTGSTGHGDDFVQKLVGKCGTLDVDDVMASVKHLIEIGVAEEGPGKQLVLGGSHGGFIAGHLLGQYPDFFSAGVLLNPVITPEPSYSDIPDWYFEEFGVHFDAKTLLTPSTYEKLWPMSAISHVDKVKAPVLLLMGLDDRRVANTHGRAFYHALKGRGMEVEMLEFKGEAHPIDGVEAARVCWEAEVDWFERFRA